MAPRKKRGSKAPVNRKAKATPVSNLSNVLDTEVTVRNQNIDDGNDSTSVNSNSEAIKPTVVTRAHKKFGKFRFLLENDPNHIESNENKSLTDNDIAGSSDQSNETTNIVDIKTDMIEIKSSTLEAPSITQESDITVQAVNIDTQIINTISTVEVEMEEPSAFVKDNLIDTDKKDNLVLPSEKVEQDFVETYVTEEEIVPTADSLIETEIVDECDEIFEIHTLSEENEETYGNVIEIQTENETKQTNDMPDTVFIPNEQLVEGDNEVVIEDTCLLEQIVCTPDDDSKAAEDQDQSKVPLQEDILNEPLVKKEELVEEHVTSSSSSELAKNDSNIEQEIIEDTIEEKLEKITMSDANEADKRLPIERRRSRRKLNQKVNENKVVAPVEFLNATLHETKIVDDVEEIKIKVEEIEIDSKAAVQIEDALIKSEPNTPTKKVKRPSKIKTDDKQEECPKNQEKKSKKDQKPRQKLPKPLKDKKKTTKQDQIDRNESIIRRSNRIKSISVQKQKSKGHGLVKTKKGSSEPDDGNNTTNYDKTNDVLFPVPKLDIDQKPVKVKSRWRRSSELEMYQNSSRSNSPMIMDVVPVTTINDDAKKKVDKEEVHKRLKQFIHIKDNHYLTDRLSCKEAKKMTCDCFLTQEEMDRKEYGCGEDCLNRLLMIECGSLCSVGDRCTNKRFQKGQFAPCEVFKTDKKGLGIRAAANIPYGEFILEYVGEVLDPDEFENRAEHYSKDKNIHYYFMSLRADAVIDATQKGNISRFINHSCEPNAETQKWTVNGELRIGFFSKRTIFAGEEITFDYQFQRYGKEAQKCYCESESCRGWLGEEPDDDDEDEDDEDEEEEEDETKAVKEETKVEDVVKEEFHKTDDAVEEVVVEKPVKKERKKVVKPKKTIKDMFDDLDLDEEIETLLTTGLKNQAHTLKLSRLMVRAKETLQRIHLLTLLREGEMPCRRLFLDYHGLRLIHGWMTDVPHSVKVETKIDNIRLDILQTLEKLPIPNKTMLKDSKVLPTVEQWSEAKFDSGNSPLDSDTNSPQIDELKCSKTDNQNIEKIESLITPSSTTTSEENDVPTQEVLSVKAELEYNEKIITLAKKLVTDWSGLKEVFRIPKKERIEQMKEHEREANRGYKAGLGLEQDNMMDKKCESRYRINQKYKVEKVDLDRSRKDTKLTGRKSNPKMSKFERRKMFAMKVEQEAEERRRQQEFWRQHEQNCMMIGADPRFTAPFDPTRGYQYVWNQQRGQWQNYKQPNNSTNMTHRNYYSSNNIPLTNISNHSHQNGMDLMNIGRNLNLHNTSMSSSISMQNNVPNIGNNIPTLGNNVPSMSNIGNNGKSIQGMPLLSYHDSMDITDASQVAKFMGPIPPPVNLPPKWKCAKDKYGRPYYYHIKIRRSQWEPPDLSTTDDIPDDLSETTSSSDTSSLSSDTTSEESDSDDDIDDTKLLLEIKKKFKRLEEETKINDIRKIDETIEVNQDLVQTEQLAEDNVVMPVEEQVTTEIASTEEVIEPPPVKKRRTGLVQEIIISPRTEEEKLQYKENMKKVKENKERQKRHKEIALKQTKKHADGNKSQKPVKKHKVTVKTKLKEMTTDVNSESSRKIKETFRSNMASVMVSILNHYRKPDCKEGRITNTEDFKHLARKLTHFVMLKELKHCQNIEDLTCTESVKSKAKEFVRKYMCKFGEIYLRPKDDLDSF